MKHAVWMASLLLGALLLTACGDDSEKTSAEKAAATAPGKKVFVAVRTSAHKSLDPVKQFDSASAELVHNVYDTLLTYHYLKRPYELEPNLLNKMPERSADKLTYTFELRDDVRFMDDPAFPGGKGRTLNTDDVIYSIKRFADANQNVESYVLWQDVVEGMDAFRKRTKELGAKTDYDKLDIAGIKKLDDRRFTIKLKQPNPLALYPLAATQLSIVPREAVEHHGDQFERHPVGTGPFRIKEYERRGVMVLEKNPDYHRTYPTEGAPGDAEKGLLKSAGKQLPLVDELHLPLIEEPQPAMLKFLSGEVDWVAIDKANFAKMAYKDDKGFHLKPEYAAKFELYTEPSVSTEFFAFNMKDPLVGKNKALRQAFAYALDKEAYVERMRNGRGQPVDSVVPPAIPGGAAETGVEGIPHNLAKAKAKLAEAGYPEGKGLPPIVVEYRASNTTARQDHEFYRAQLARAGIKLAASYQTFSAFLRKIETANFQVIDFGWHADFPDAANFYQLLYSHNRPPGPNHGAYSNPEYDRLYEQSRFMENGPERYALFKQMSLLVDEDVPLIPTWSQTVAGMHQKWVQNFKRNVMLDKHFAFFDIDAAAEAQGQR